MPSSSRTRAGTGSANAKLASVAERAGVSPSTVSRILNGTAVVSGDKRAAVIRAIADLGFKPNPIARSLAGGRTLSVGVVTQSIDSPFYGVALRGIEDELDKAGYSALFVSGHWNAIEEARCIDILRSRRVDGVIVLTGRLSDQDLRDCAKALPVVVTGRNLDAQSLYSLNFDNVGGARMATEYLISLGHRRIACIAGDTAHQDAVERLEGYRLALQQAGIAFEPELVEPGQFHEESGRMAMEHLLDRRQRFTAAFACNDQMAYGAALAMFRRGLRVPDDVSLMGFDNLASAVYAIPPLSTINQSGYELGRIASLAMLQLISGSRPNLLVPAPQLVVRESCKRLQA